MDTCIHMAESLHGSRNYHNIVNWLYSNTKYLRCLKKLNANIKNKVGEAKK